MAPSSARRGARRAGSRPARRGKRCSRLRAEAEVPRGLRRLSRAALRPIECAACVRRSHRLAWRPVSRLGLRRVALLASSLCHCAGRHRGLGGRELTRLRRLRRQGRARRSRLRRHFEQAYRICLWSRVANRVLLELAKFPAPTPEALYDGARAVVASSRSRQHVGRRLHEHALRDRIRSSRR